MNGKTAYLLLQSIKSQGGFAFSSPLSNLFQSELKGTSNFTIDNFSDSMMIEYARKFIDESESVTIICEKVETETLGAWMPVLNYATNQKKVAVLAIGESRLTAPFIKMKKGKVFGSEEELRQTLINQE